MDLVWCCGVSLGKLEDECLAPRIASHRFIASVYAGHHSILIDPAEVELNPSVWMNAISHYKSKWHDRS